MQTSDNKMKTFNDFADEAFDIFCKSEIKVNILIIQSNLYAAYAFEEGCKAQKIICSEKAKVTNRETGKEVFIGWGAGRSPAYGKETIHEVDKKSIFNSQNAPNPFSSPQNNEQ